MSMEFQWNYIDRGKLNNLVKDISQCHFVHHMAPGSNPGLLPLQACDIEIWSSNEELITVLPTFFHPVCGLLHNTRAGPGIFKLPHYHNSNLSCLHYFAYLILLSTNCMFLCFSTGIGSQIGRKKAYIMEKRSGN
jgi:hypothetical protein